MVRSCVHVVQAIIKLWIGLCHLRRLIYLSGLVHNLNVVTVGVESPGCVIVRMILELGRRYNFLPSACCNCSCKEGIHLRVAFGDKTE